MTTADEDIEAHIRACGMNMKKYKKIEGVVLKILKSHPTEHALLKVFAKKCYNSFPEESGRKQAKKFLKVLYNDLGYLVDEGPARAIEKASQRNKGSKKTMRIVRLNKPVDGFTKKLDCYLVGETIGKGATSVVKRGRRDTEQKEEVAVKILTVDGRSFQLAELMKEIQVLRELDHKNVIKMYDCFENVQYPGYTNKPTTVMVLELATKGELFDFFMHTGRFEPPLARWFFNQMIDGLEYCHSKQIAHRDLKPENLLMGEGFNVKLVDFGFARFFRDDQTGEDVKMKTALGTPGYAAPEILQRKPYDQSVDIFSLGVILFICIAGFPPFQEAKLSDWWFDKIIKKKYALFWKAHERVLKFDDDAKDILLGMLAARPQDRYTWDQLRNHKWMSKKTLTQSEAATTLMMLKKKVDVKLAGGAQNTGIVLEKQRALADHEVEPPLLGNYLPVNHIYTALSGKLALDEVQTYIMINMSGNVKLVSSNLWVGPVPDGGLKQFKEEEEKTYSPKIGSTSSLGLPSEITEEGVEKNETVGFYWQDLQFAVSIIEEKNDEKAEAVDDEGLPDLPNSVTVNGKVFVRQHPTKQAKDGKLLNVVYLKRVGNVLPYHWSRVSNAILTGIAHLMEGTESKYFRGRNSASGVASNAVSSLLCCSSDAAKKLAE